MKRVDARALAGALLGVGLLAASAAPGADESGTARASILQVGDREPERGARAEPRTHVEAIEAASARCRAGDVEGASVALRDLLAALEGEGREEHPATPIVLFALASVERARGRGSEARSLEERAARAGAGSSLPPELDQTVKDLRACSGLGSAAPRSWSESVAGFEKDLERARDILERGRVAEAHRAARMLALNQLAFGDPERALRAALLADAAARQLDEPLARIELARLEAHAGDFEGAGVALDELEPSARDAVARAELDEARGDLALLLGSPSRALSHLEPALREHEASFGRDHLSTAAVRQLIGDAHRQLGDFPAALAAYREVLRVRQAEASDPDTARTQNAIGVLRASRGDWSAADEAFAAALSALEKSLGATHPETLSVRLNAARVAWGRTRSDSAADQYAQAVEALRAARGEHPQVAEALRNLARIETERDRFERAAALLDQAFALQRQTLGETHPDATLTRLERGKLLARRGELTAAAAEVAAATESLANALGAAHPLVGRYRMELARIAEARGDGSTAHTQALEAARVIALDLQRSFGAMSERQRTLLARDAAGVVGALLSAPGAPARETYLALLPHRDSVVRSLAASRASVRRHPPEAEAIPTELARKRERYVAAILAGTPEAAARARRLTREIDELEAGAAAAGGPVSNPHPGRILADACVRLPDDAAIVEFVAYDRTERGAPVTTVPAYAAFVVRGEACSVTRVDLREAAAIESATRRFDEAMREARYDEPQARAELARALLEPLREPLRGARRWFVVPDARLWGVPLGALPDPDDAHRYLLERVTLVYVTSIHELADVASATRPLELSRALLFGAPEFGESEGSGPTILTGSGRCALRPFEPLPATRTELEAIAPLLGTSAVVTGADATKARLRDELSRAPELVHIATHAYFAGRDGCPASSSSGSSSVETIDPHPLLLSGIVLAGANRAGGLGDGEQSGVLTAYEVAGLDLREVRLVVLSACDTGAGLHERGQEVQGLRWGFREAGGRALVTSLWSSNDAVTRRLMQDFYQVLRTKSSSDGFRGAEALRQAQLERVRADRRLGQTRPLWWANFVFSGVL